ncbi:hypothetical protein ABI59_04885 [Acidobacteria bacterium Mor1]|nr:hypothetical protein ABI59_04885 [Acidobacteria bacterium Mor1]
MRLLVVSGVFPPAWSWGGQARSIWNMCRAAAGAGAEVSVLTTDADLEGRVPSGERVEEGIRIRTLPVLGPARRFALAPRLLPAVLGAVGSADLVVIQGVWTWPMLIAPRACRMRGVPYVVVPRGTLESISLAEKAGKKALYWKLLEARAVRGARAIQFASRQELENSREASAGTPGMVSENPIEFADRAAGDPAGLRKRLGLEASDRILGIFGRIHPRKGFEIVIPALAGCSDRVHLAVFGADEAGHQARMEQLAARHGVSQRVHFLGQVDGAELAQAYASVDLTVLPSLGESFGNTALESLAQGTEALVSEGVPLKGYLVEHGGRPCVAPNDAATWAERLDEWMASSREFDGEHASRVVREDFSLERIGSRLLADYRKLIGAAPAASSGTGDA